MKRKIALIFMLFLATSVFASSNTETEIRYLSGRGSDDTVPWQFKVTRGRRANEWSTIRVPSNWELQGFGAYNYGHDHPKSDEKGFYRTTFTIPVRWQSKRIFIVFEGSMTDTEVRVNGRLAGPVHRGGFYQFRYEITGLVRFDKKNFLQVLVSKVSADSTVELAERRSDYWVFGGIYRPVYLEAVPREFIEWTAIDARADGSFRANVFLNGSTRVTRVTAQIYRPDGSLLGKVFSAEVKSGEDSVFLATRVAGQKSWTAETPNLYRVEFRLLRGKTVLHVVRQRFGFRTFEIRKGKGLFLNGRRIVLKGCSRHSFWPTTGRALNRNRCRQDILTIKQMNMNAVRMSHYPPDSYFLDLCDELGLYRTGRIGRMAAPAVRNGSREKTANGNGEAGCESPQHFVLGQWQRRRLEWMVDGSGWLRLDYSVADTGKVDYLGILFDYPEKRVHKMTWLGKGPYRVWKNRLKAQTIDVWENGYKNFKPGTVWNYPEFTGYYANVNWVVFRTEDGPITLAADSDSLFLRVFSQPDGDHPRHTKMVWAPGGISVLKAIPAMGTKFKDADKFGPESQKFQAKGVYSGTVYFYFGLP